MHENRNVKRTYDGTRVVNTSAKTKGKQNGTNIRHNQTTYKNGEFLQDKL
jgi:hypothetical protein